MKCSKFVLLKLIVLVLVMVVLFVVVVLVGVVEMNVKIEILILNVVEYYWFYFVVWIECVDQSVVVNLVVWYDVKKKDKEGEKWLKDMC